MQERGFTFPISQYFAIYGFNLGTKSTILACLIIFHLHNVSLIHPTSLLHQVVPVPPGSPQVVIVVYPDVMGPPGRITSRVGLKFKAPHHFRGNLASVLCVATVDGHQVSESE